MTRELEKEKESEKVKRLEKETEGLKRLIERTEKEKDEKVKQLEMDRDKWIKETEEYKRRAEKAEKDRICFEMLDSFLRGNRLHKLYISS